MVTSFEQVDAIATRLADRKHAWTQVSTSDRIRYLQQCIEDLLGIAEPWAAAACRAKGIAPDAVLAGEEWFVGPIATVTNLQSLIRSLQANGQPRTPRVTQQQRQTIAHVFPDNLLDRLAWAGFTGEVWMQPDRPATQGTLPQAFAESGQVALVLGAGNIASIAPMDALYKLFVENTVVVVKMNPVNEYLGPFLTAAFRCLQEEGFFEVVYGGSELGRYLCQHPAIDTIHITGSHHTYNAIVWGETPEERAWRQAANQPFNAKPITAELGCVTPILVVPGVWSETDITYHARQLAGMVAHNASFNCAAAKVVVLAQGWPQRAQFLTQLQQELAATPPRKAYYPGAQERYQAFLDRYPQAKPLGSRTEDIVPWTLIPNVPARAGEYALTQEAFCGVLAEVSLDATDAGEFLRQAVPFVNEQVWGNLSCAVLIDPKTQKRYETELETAIAQLRYGAITLNVWSVLVYALPSLTWGAYPGNPPIDIQSGHGIVHNTYGFDYPQKSVLRAPFRIAPLPSWFPRHRNLLKLAQGFLEFQAKPSYHKLPGLIWGAMKG